MDYTNKVITTTDGKKYLIIEQVVYEEKIFLYLVNEENEKDSLFVEARDNKFLQVDSDLFSKKVLPLFINKITNNKSEFIKI